MKKCCFIIPYFGKLPNYFQLFLNSCSYNPSFNWILFTDDMTEFDYPENVQRVQMSFEEVVRLTQSKFEFKISLARPYKLCDFKPAYGYIFADWLVEYKAWGHCDIDLVLGHLEDFITDYLIESYDKLFCLGHLSVYKNTLEMTELFMNEWKGQYLFKDVYTTDNICVFDESGEPDEKNINSLLIQSSKRVYAVDHSLNINYGRHYFRRTVYKGNNEYPNRRGFEPEPYRSCVYLWDKGYVNRYFIYDGKLIKGNYAYIHLAHRKMKLNAEVLGADCIQIMPNEFRRFKHKDITKLSFRFIPKHPYTLTYYKKLWEYYPLCFLSNVYQHVKDRFPIIRKIRENVLSH